MSRLGLSYACDHPGKRRPADMGSSSSSSTGPSASASAWKSFIIWLKLVLMRSDQIFRRTSDWQITSRVSSRWVRVWMNFKTFTQMLISCNYDFCPPKLLVFFSPFYIQFICYEINSFFVQLLIDCCTM